MQRKNLEPVDRMTTTERRNITTSFSGIAAPEIAKQMDLG
jgi:hypothetical protein